MTHLARSLLHKMTRQQLIARLCALTGANDRAELTPASTDGALPAGTQDVQLIELHMRHKHLSHDYDRVNASLDAFTELYENLPVAHFTTDSKGRITQCNALAGHLLSQDADALVGKSFFDQLAAASRQPFRFHLRTLQNNRPPEPILVELRPPLSGHHYVEIVARAIVHNSCKVFHLVATDVSRIRALAQRERFLAETSERLFDLLDPHRVLDAAISMCAPILADIAFGFAFGSDQTLKHEAHQNEGARLNGSAQDLLREVSQSLSARWLDEIQADRSQVFLLQVDGAHDHAPWLPESHLRLMAALNIAFVAVVPLVARGHTLGAIVFFSLAGHTSGPDLSFVQLYCERVALAMDNAGMLETLRDDVRMRDTVLATVSHDLKNPLSAILLKTERAMMWAERRGTQGSVVDVMKSIHSCGLRMQRLTQDLLDVSSVERNDLAIQKTWVQLSELTEQAMDSAREKSAAREIDLVLRLGDTPDLNLLCDRQRLLQVLGNLLDNAIKFSPQGGRVALEVRYDGAQICTLSVLDTGRGFRKEELEIMFERFWRRQDTAHLGHGLGLYISRGIVQAHGGTIWAENLPLEGARVAFTLPVEMGRPQTDSAIDA